MKNVSLVAFFLLAASCVIAQTTSVDTTIKIDLLKAPSSPASSLLSISPTDVDKPTDISAFMVSLQSATNSFTKLPANYAVDFAPYWLFNKRRFNSIDSMGITKGAIVRKQTFVISVAIRNTDSTETTLNKNSIYGGVGFKFSIIRGGFTDEVQKNIDKISAYQKKATDNTMKALLASDSSSVFQQKRAELKKLLAEDPALQKEATRTLQKEVNNLLQEHIDGKAKIANLKNSEKEIKELAAKFQVERCGWNWDVAGGISTEFREKAFNNTKVYNAGLWTTVGYTGKKGSTFLFILRYLYNPDKVFALENKAPETANISTADGGLKYCFSSPQSKLNISLEALYRSILSSKTIDPSYRLVFNADYALWQNQKLTFSFGRNFDGVITKGGNLVAALSFLTGFGNNK